MELPYTGSGGGGGGNWTMIPNIPTHSNSPAHSNEDQFYLHQQNQTPPQQLNQFQQQQFQHEQQQSFNQFQFQKQQQRIVQQQQQQQQDQNQQHLSLASHFHLLHLVENLADVIENGTTDQHSDALTVEGQKRNLEETEQILNHRRDLIGKFRNSVEELIKTEL